MYYLKLSGFIPKNKEVEFEQTYRFARFQIPETCTEYNFSKDVLEEGIYYFISYWTSLPELESYVQSAAFFMITGAFKTLGSLYVKSNGEIDNGIESKYYDVYNEANSNWKWFSK